jgi:hypothetical protein
MAATAFRSSAASLAGPAEKSTFPLERTVRTSSKPAASKAARRSGIRAFTGLTPRRRAA